MTKDTVQAEALNEISKYKRCGVAISMGVGKTRIAIQHLNSLDNPKALVVVPKLSIKKAWIDELNKLGLTDKLINNISFTTYLSLNKHDPNDYTIVYLDECHSILPIHQLFLNVYTGNILGLTGTPPVNSYSDKYKLIQKYCPIVYNFSVDDATKDILNDYVIIVHKLNLSTLRTVKKKNRQGGFWYTSELDDYNYLTNRYLASRPGKDRQMSSIMRMRGLMEYKTKESFTKQLMNNSTGKCIIFANTQEQADRICNHSYHSQNPNSEDNLRMFSDGTIDKLSCVMQLSEGVTIPNLGEGIIMHAYGNERKTAQRIGRLLRLNPELTAICHILCYKNTVDETWIEQALEVFDKNKIIYENHG